MESGITTPTVSLVNLKGGVGKTALTVNLAFALAEWHDQNVLVVDVDPQFNATQHLLEESVIVSQLAGRTVKDILDPPPAPVRTGKAARQKQVPPREYLQSVAIEGNGKLDILPSLLDLSIVNRNPAGKEGRLEKFLRKVADDYDVILLDCPPTISVLSHAAFNCSRYYLVPVTPDYFAPIGIPLIEEEVQYFMENLHTETAEMRPLGLVYTLVDDRAHSEWRNVARRVANESEIEAFSTYFTQSKYWRDCAGAHDPVYRAQRTKAQKDQLEAFTDEFLERLEEAEEARRD